MTVTNDDERTRASTGEAKITQLASGSYRAQVMIAGRRHSVAGKTKEEVKRKRRELLHNADRGILPPTQRLTVAEHVERWLEDVVKHSVRRRTYETYHEKMRLYILPALGGVKLERLSPADLQKLYGELLAHGGAGGGPLSPRTVRHVHTYLHGCLGQALKWGLVPRNVADLVSPPRRTGQRSKSWTLSRCVACLPPPLPPGGRR
ncbi:MAG: N-terminal phage integrase SAM-like domain-containing protein, partial [Chloroflexia bacterium]